MCCEVQDVVRSQAIKEIETFCVFFLLDGSRFPDSHLPLLVLLCAIVKNINSISRNIKMHHNK